MLLLEDKMANMVTRCLSNYVPEQFGIDIKNDDDSMLEDYYMPYKSGIEMCHGITKAVFVSESCSYVLKVPFKGSFCSDEYYNEEEDMWYDAEPIFEYFEYANDTEYEDATCWDYCENELLKYEDAVEAGYGDFFPVTKFYKYTSNSYPLYIQEKCIPYSNGISSHTPSDKSMKKAENLHIDRAPRDWTALLIDWYGEDRVEKFVRYLDNANIDDLHRGNIGFMENGRPIIIDFSGWRD